MMIMMIMMNVLYASLYVVSKRWQAETEDGAYETLRTPFSSATADRNMGAGLYVQNMWSNNRKMKPINRHQKREPHTSAVPKATVQITESCLGQEIKYVIKRWTNKFV